MKKLLIACLFAVVFCSGNVYSHETMSVGFQVDSLYIYDYQVDYIDLDVTLGNYYYHVSGLSHFTDNNISLLSGAGYNLPEYGFFLIEARLTMDYIYIQLNYDGSGNIDYYTLSNGELSLMDSSPVTIVSVE